MGVQPGVSLLLSKLERDEFAHAQSGSEILPKLDHLLDLDRVPRFITDRAGLLVPADDLEGLERPGWNRDRLVSLHRRGVNVLKGLTCDRSFLQRRLVLRLSNAHGPHVVQAGRRASVHDGAALPPAFLRQILGHRVLH